MNKIDPGQSSAAQSANLVAIAGWVIFVGLIAASLLLKWDTYGVALLVGPCWLAYYYMRFAGWDADPSVADPRFGVFVLGLLLCLFQFVHFVRNNDLNADRKNLQRVCASPAAQTKDGQVVCDEIESILENPTNSLSSNDYE